MKYWLYGALLCLGACQTRSATEQETPTLQEALPGVWATIAFRVTLNATDSSAVPEVFEVPENEWEVRLGMRPIMTYYDLDHRYRMEYRNSADSLTRLTRGLWNVFGDTLMLIAPDATYQYEVKVAGKRATFRCLLDWDGDGKENDEYIGIQEFIREN
ncbi:MAG TPA: hypothetical protein PKC76_15740 [Saprospiraceae bacterium]|nr:hypothetical protein [Saprospiraceae bacterium]HMP25585.1 hypothetical protein [Saprospiraceae bacterium]